MEQIHHSSIFPLVTFLAGELNDVIREQLEMDMYNFGEIILEVLTNGRLAGAGESILDRSKDALLREICIENGLNSNDSIQQDVRSVLEVALLCTQRRTSDRSTARNALMLLLERKSSRK